MTYPHLSASAAERPQGPQKSPQAFRTISEVAEDLDVPAHVLRFWESRFVQVRPLKRGGGRRYYRPGDVDLLKGIRRLLYDEGMTIKGAQKVMRERGVRFVTGLGRGETDTGVLPEGAPRPDGQETEFGPKTGAENGAKNVSGAETVAEEGVVSGSSKPLLTPEKRANLEAALAVLSDLREELSTIVGGDSAGDGLGHEVI